MFAERSTRSSGRFDYVVSSTASTFKQVSVGAVPLLKLFGIVAGGWQLMRSAAIASERLEAPGRRALAAREFYRAKIETARFSMRIMCCPRRRVSRTCSFMERRARCRGRL